MRLFGQQFEVGVLRDPISAIIGVGGAIVNGILGHKAAKSAAETQAEAADKAGQEVKDATAGVTPTILQAGKDAGAGVTGAAVTANKFLDPYATAGAQASGTLAEGLKAGGDFNKVPTMADLQIDPGYAFRLQQGQIALDRSAAARGGVLSGAALKATSDYAQGSASQEFQNAFQRFETAQQNRVANLTGVANRGYAAAGASGANLLDASKYSGTANMNETNLASGYTVDAAKTAADYLTQSANAKAAGTVAGTNAITGAISGGVGAVSSAQALQQQQQLQSARIYYLRNNPAVPQNDPTAGAQFGDY